jgi:hypothetical protein
MFDPRDDARDQEFLQAHNRGRSEATAVRTETNTRSASGRASRTGRTSTAVHFPDYRIEYEVDGRELHEDVELFTEPYRGAHAASQSQTGFRIHVVGSRAVRAASARHEGIPVTHAYPPHDILAFAERILPRAADLWVQASLDHRQRLQEPFFPEGIAYDGNRFNRTAVTAPLFRYLEPDERAEEDLASPGGTARDVGRVRVRLRRAA